VERVGERGIRKVSSIQSEKNLEKVKFGKKGECIYILINFRCFESLREKNLNR